MIRYLHVTGMLFRAALEHCRVYEKAVLQLKMGNSLGNARKMSDDQNGRQLLLLMLRLYLSLSWQS